ncbi:MAG: hypothetical protein FWG37_04040 [Clostridia bacterium]|nr:hypothetical protein [Clostridia bacterium]
MLPPKIYVHTDAALSLSGINALFFGKKSALKALIFMASKPHICYNDSGNI